MDRAEERHLAPVRNQCAGFLGERIGSANGVFVAANRSGSWHDEFDGVNASIEEQTGGDSVRPELP